MEHIKIKYKFEDVSELLEKDIRQLVMDNIEGKMDNYFKTVFKKVDAEIMIEITIQKNKKEKYEWNFKFHLDYKDYNYTREYVSPIDLVNSAFAHLKEQLSDKKSHRNRWAKTVQE